MPSNLSSCSIEPAGLVSAADKVMGVGSELPVEITDTVGEPPISVTGGLFRSCEGMNSCAVPMTETELPITAAAGIELPVKTKTPSDVFGSASTVASGS